MKITCAIAALAGIATVANAGVTINEVLGNPVGSDYEFIELFNDTGASIDLTGWSVSLYESDGDNGAFGGQDATAPYILSGSIGAGGYFTLGNTAAQTTLGFTADQLFGGNSIENSSYTMVLRDASMNIIETIFVVDDDGDINDGGTDIANIDGTPITPDFIASEGFGSFLPAGFYRLGDGAAEFGYMDFFDVAATATPGAANVPAPGALALLGLGGLATARRRR